MSTLTQPLKWAGGKHYLAPKIVALMPKHLHYVEPYAGGLSVLLERDPNDPKLWLGTSSDKAGVSEVVNDINKDLTSFWKVLRNPEGFAALHRRCQATPLSKIDFDIAAAISREPQYDPESLEFCVIRAWAFFVRARQSRAGTFKGFTSLTRSRVRRGINGNASEWLGAIEGLPAVHARLQPVVIEEMNAIKLIRREDAPGTLMYLDAPYLHSTRASKDLYAHEMTDDQHQELLEMITSPMRQSKFMVSGYGNEFYDRMLKGWTRHEFDLPNHQAGGKSKRRMTEVLWCNF